MERRTEITTEKMLWLAAIMFVVICALIAKDYYKNFQANAENVSFEKYRMQQYNRACAVDEVKCNRCADYADASDSFAMDRSLKCLKSVIEHGSK